ncbi:MAG: alginate lyase family protein [Alphaproteobacteria bacterium]|nr:alginate lyase family protein [Alphaproteobacteria bacterium]
MTSRNSTRRGVLATLPGLALAACRVDDSAVPGTGGPAAGPRFAALPEAEIVARLRRPSAPLAAFLRRAGADVGRAPDPVATIHVEGTLPGQGIYDRSIEATRDFPRILDFAVAWRATGEPRLLELADRFLRAWTDVYRVSLNPIDEERFDVLLLAADLVRGHVDPATDAGVDRLSRRFAEGYCAHLLAGGRRGSDVNNWSSHRAKLAALSAFALGDPALLARAREGFVAHLDRTIVGADGEVVDFGERDAIHYVVYSILPLLIACHAARAHGEDWLARRNRLGASVATAIDWLAPYAERRKTHQEFVHSRVGFDAVRARAGLANFAGPWDPARAINLFALAAALDPRWRGIADRLVAESGRPPSDWIRLLLA